MKTVNRSKKLSYNYDLISGKVNLVAYQPPLQDQANPNKTNPNADAFYHRYNYDAENRLTSVETSRDNILWTRDAKYNYYRHGPLARTELGDLHVQGVDYAYTIQGWLKGVNSTSVGTAYDMGGDGQTGSIFARDAYGLSLNYFNGDYNPINVSVTPFTNVTVANDLFNGNIKAQVVNIPKLGNPLVYGYQYDQLNRLVSVDAYNGLDNATNAFTPVSIQDYKERLSYDPNGNIQTYLRNGTGSSTILNNYRYSYSNQLSQNQLTSIFNSVNGTTYSYAYDQLGNVTKDDKQGVTNAVWNVYGKLQTVTKADGTTITYTYSPDLQRASKKVGNVSEFYVRDATGNLMATYKKDPALNNGDLTLTETYKYGSSLLSINTEQINVEHPVTSTSTTFTAGNDGYQVTDQNGNTRLVLSDKKTQVSLDGSTVDHYEAVVNTANHFSAFGAISKSIGNVSVLGFNGQRKSTEIGQDAQTAIFWEYNSDVGRRWNVDPVKKAWESPYAAFSNNPILRIDPTGAVDLPGTAKNKYGENQVYTQTEESDNGMGGVSFDKKTSTPQGQPVTKNMTERDIYRLALVRVINPGEFKISDDQYLDEKYFLAEEKINYYFSHLVTNTAPNSQGQRELASKTHTLVANGLLSGDNAKADNAVSLIDRRSAWYNSVNWAPVVVSLLPGSLIKNIGTRLSSDAKFAQTWFTKSFSAEGKFAGQTIEEVAGLLKSGGIQVSSVPVLYIEREGTQLILNTRSAASLTMAGIKRGNWNAINVTGNEFFENLLNGQLKRNGLTNAGIATTTLGKNGSTVVGSNVVIKH